MGGDLEGLGGGPPKFEMGDDPCLHPPNISRHQDVLEKKRIFWPEKVVEHFQEKRENFWIRIFWSPKPWAKSSPMD